MSTKYYKVKKDTFLWKEGAILSESSHNGNYGYTPIEDFWNVVPEKDEYISSKIIEHANNTDWFERVYKDTLSGNIFRTADQMKKLYQDAFKT